MTPAAAIAVSAIGVYLIGVAVGYLWAAMRR